MFDRLYATLQDVELNDTDLTAIVRRMVILTKELLCLKCGGKGWYILAEHDCGGDIDKCVYTCPIQVQVPCECGINNGE